MRWKKYKAAALSAVLCLGLAGCGLTDVINNEIRADYTVIQGAEIYPDSTASVKKTSEQEEILSNFELALQNDYLELYIGTRYDIAVFEKTSGQLTLSNPVYYDLSSSELNSLSSEAQRQMLSQLSVEYYTDLQTKMTMASYPDAYSADKNQVSWEVVDDTLRVTYGIGTNLEESVMIDIFTKETYEGYVQRLQEMRDAKEISTITVRNLTNNYTKYAWDELSSDEKKRYTERWPNLEELGTIYVIKDRLSAQITRDILEVYTILGIDESVKEAEKEKLGAAGASASPAFFRIPLCYRLSGADLLVSVDISEIEASSSQSLTKVEMLKCFGSSKASDEGYVFVPDGSGSVFDNNIDSNSMDKVVIPFYGEDKAVELTEGTSEAINNTFPVFGIKANDHAVFAIVENGAAVGGMTAQAHSTYMNYNVAYPYFDYQIMDEFGIQGVSYAYYENVADVDYTVRYHFLNGEDADYVGMAQYYQKYLEQTGALTRLTDTDNTWGLNIELLGSMQKKVNPFGIPLDINYSVTTFEQAQEIMDILHSNGIADVDVLFTGIMNGGMEQKALSKVKIESKLGGLKGYQTLNSTLASQGDTLYTGIDPVRIAERGNGVRKTEDVSKYLTKNSVIVGTTSPVKGNMWQMWEQFWLINPLRYEDITAKFIKAFDNVGNKNLYVQIVGETLCGNYSAKEGVTRQTAQILTENMLSMLKDAGYQLKFDVGNDYVLQYAESLINVPTSSSHQRLESYSVPFVGMVLKGYLPFTCTSINQSSNVNVAMLEAVESGAGLNYLLIYDNQLNLIDTNYENLFSVNYMTQMDGLLENYKKINEQMGHLQNLKIMDHKHLTEDVNCVTYEDGTKVYVNYGKEAYKAPEGTVEALSWLVVGR